MRITAPLVVGSLMFALSACQPATEETDAAFTSGPEADAAPDAASEAAEVETDAPNGDEAEVAQQSAPPASDAVDMGAARSREESVEPDSPTMFH